MINLKIKPFLRLNNKEVYKGIELHQQRRLCSTIELLEVAWATSVGSKDSLLASATKSFYLAQSTQPTRLCLKYSPANYCRSLTHTKGPNTEN